MYIETFCTFVKNLIVFVIFLFLGFLGIFGKDLCIQMLKKAQNIPTVSPTTVPLPPLTPLKGGLRGESPTHESRTTDFCPKMFGKSAEALKRLKKHFWKSRVIFQGFWKPKSIFEKKRCQRKIAFFGHNSSMHVITWKQDFYASLIIKSSYLQF